MASVQFYYERPAFRKKYLNAITERKRWIRHLIELHNRRLVALSFIFLSDEGLLKINQEHLNHDYYTDIITFNLSENPEEDIEGDIYISVERVNENAAANNTSTYIELTRVMSHGVLHLMGFDDKSESDRQTMRQQEEEAMELFANQFESK